jgi:Protein of unknown function (DUF4232)
VTSAPASTTPSPSAPAPRACRAAALTVKAAATRSLGRVSDVEFAFATNFTVLNTSASACTLNGWPGVALRGSGSHQVCAAGTPVASCPPYPDRTSYPPQTYTRALGARSILLPPRGSTLFSLHWQGVSCIRPPYLVDFQVPGDTRFLPVVLPDMCSGPIVITAFGST